MFNIFCTTYAVELLHVEIYLNILGVVRATVGSRLSKGPLLVGMMEPLIVQCSPE